MCDVNTQCVVCVCEHITVFVSVCASSVSVCLHMHHRCIHLCACVHVHVCRVSVCVRICVCSVMCVCASVFVH